MADPLTLTALEGDTLDLLLWREAALGPAALSVVMEANRGLAELGALLPPGTTVVVPATTPQNATLPLINLWD